jgi:hypothetical protein
MVVMLDEKLQTKPELGLLHSIMASCVCKLENVFE